MSFSERGPRVIIRRHLGVAAVVLAFASAAIFVSWLWNSSGDHPCVPDAPATFDQFVSGGLAPPAWESERVSSGTDADDCSGQST